MVKLVSFYDYYMSTLVVMSLLIILIIGGRGVWEVFKMLVRIAISGA